ncbi:MAG: hypothetical protein AB7I41_16660 [Candidatus Sericytochromatia bacterium]
MTLGINSLKNLSSSNPVAPLQAPQAPVQKPSEPVQTRVQAQPQAPLPHTGAVLTDSQTIANFDHQINGLKVPELQTQVADVASETQMPEFLKHVLGQESVGAEVHGAMGVGGGYAGNTIGGIHEVFKNAHVADPKATDAYNVSNQVTSKDSEKWAISGNNRADADGNCLNEGAKVAAAFGIFVSVLGLINSSAQIHKGRNEAGISEEMGKQGQVRNQTAVLLERFANPEAEGGPLSGEEMNSLTKNLTDMAKPLSDGLAPGNTLSEDARQFMQISLDRINAVKDALPVVNGPAIQTLCQHLKADAAALKNLSEITKDESNLNKLMGSVGVVSNLNGLANGGLTIMSIVHSTGTTLGNQAAQGLIFTQAVSGVGMIVTGAIGAYQDHKAIKESEGRLERLGTYQANRPEIAEGPDKVQKTQAREKVADVGKLVKTEADNTIKTRWWSKLKNIATVVAGVALTIGVCVAAAAFVASPIGWAVGGLAAVAGIGIAAYKLYQKHQQQKTIDTLDGQHQRVSTEVKALKAEQQRLSDLPGMPQARIDKPEYDRLKADLPGKQATVGALKTETAQLTRANEEAQATIQRHQERLLELTQELTRLNNRVEPPPTDEERNTITGVRSFSEQIIAQNQRTRLDNTERMGEIAQRLQLLEPEIAQNEQRIEALRPNQELLTELTNIEAALPAREKLQGEIESRLRQVSPDHATRDLVRLIQSGNQDAKDFARDVLLIPREALEGATPAIQAELIRKNIGTAYL